MPATAWISKCWDGTQASYTPGKYPTTEHAPPGLPLQTSDPEVFVNSADLSTRTWHSAVRQYKAGSKEHSLRHCLGDLREHCFQSTATTALSYLLGLTVSFANLHSTAMSWTVYAGTYTVSWERVQETSGAPNAKFQS